MVTHKASHGLHKNRYSALPAVFSSEDTIREVLSPNGETAKFQQLYVAVICLEVLQNPSVSMNPTYTLPTSLLS